MKILNLLAQIDIEENSIQIPMVNPDESTLNTTLEVVFGLLGAIAVLAIVIAGFYFVLSRGNPEKATKARNAIIYALIGLLLAMLAFSIVRFVGSSL